jgi:hypothetical protein
MNTLLIVVCIIQLCLNIILIFSRTTDSSGNKATHKVLTGDRNATQPPNKSYRGVAVCLFLHTPTWFQRRYTMMIRNVKDNLPPDWAIQIFYTGSGQSERGLTNNPGLEAMIAKKDIILTVIPQELLKVKKKYYQLWTEKWLWENMVADQVLTFGWILFQLLISIVYCAYQGGAQPSVEIRGMTWTTSADLIILEPRGVAIQAGLDSYRPCLKHLYVVFYLTLVFLPFSTLLSLFCRTRRRRFY